MLAVNELEDGVVEYVMDKAIVRIHPGKRTEEERKVAFENAAREFWKTVQRQKQNQKPAEA